MNTIDMAKKMKREAIKFYGEAAERCDHPAGKKMFLAILEDEKEHLKTLEKTVKEMHIPLDKLTPIKNVKTALETVKHKMRVSKACSLDEMESFKIAMDMEKECVDFFLEQSEKAGTEAERTLFKRLALEEEEHFKVFSNTHSFLSDTGNWFMWEEHSIVEG